MIKLNDILHLTEDEIKNAKIILNMESDGRSHFLDWYESDPDNRNVEFTYWSHSGKRKNFNVGQLCLSFVRLKEDPSLWLLVSVGKIKRVPQTPGFCEYTELSEYQGFIGRLIIKYHKGNTYSRYIFNLKNMIDKIEVSEILPNIYEPIQFEGCENVHLNYKTLKTILDGTRYSDYRAALQGFKGIYCLTDTHTGLLYIGSASGEDGILQRWTDYKNNFTGDNTGLVELLNSKGEEYFEKYFEYTLLEVFPKHTPDKKILKRENYWKEVFKSRVFGYNNN